MATIRMKYAQLDENNLERVRSLEEQTGAVVLVMEKVHPLARLTDPQIQRIQALEKDLGVILIAYPPSVAAGG